MSDAAPDVLGRKRERVPSMAARLALETGVGRQTAGPWDPGPSACLQLFLGHMF